MLFVRIVMTSIAFSVSVPMSAARTVFMMFSAFMSVTVSVPVTCPAPIVFGCLSLAAFRKISLSSTAFRTACRAMVRAHRAMVCGRVFIFVPVHRMHCILVFHIIFLFFLLSSHFRQEASSVV
jgi:hypothetical protein